MAEGNDQILNLTSYLKEAGIPEKDIKTTNFDVEAEYDQVEDEHRNYTSVFNLIRQKSSTSKVGDEGGYGEFTIAL